MMKEALRNLSEEGLFLVLRDVELRIGSHVAGRDNPDPHYIKEQRHIVNLVQEELERRMNLQ